jgi:flagellar basal-body rod modification protein FlgD
MMAVSGVNSATSAPTTTASAATQAASNLVDYNSFLRLLVAQMKNQDPMNPTDSTQYLSQLASFSSVEQQVQTNAKLDQLINSSGLNQADSLLGHTVSNTDGSVSGKVVSVTYSSAGLTATLDSGVKLPVTTDLTVS